MIDITLEVFENICTILRIFLQIPGRGTKCGKG